MTQPMLRRDVDAGGRLHAYIDECCRPELERIRMDGRDLGNGS